MIIVVLNRLRSTTVWSVQASASQHHALSGSGRKAEWSLESLRCPPSPPPHGLGSVTFLRKRKKTKKSLTKTASGVLCYSALSSGPIMKRLPVGSVKNTPRRSTEGGLIEEPGQIGNISPRLTGARCGPHKNGNVTCRCHDFVLLETAASAGCFIRHTS